MKIFKDTLKANFAPFTKEITAESTPAPPAPTNEASSSKHDTYLPPLLEPWVAPPAPLDVVADESSEDPTVEDSGNDSPMSAPPVDHLGTEEPDEVVNSSDEAASPAQRAALLSVSVDLDHFKETWLNGSLVPESTSIKRRREPSPGPSSSKRAKTSDVTESRSSRGRSVGVNHGSSFSKAASPAVSDLVAMWEAGQNHRARATEKEDQKRVNKQLEVDEIMVRLAKDVRRLRELCDDVGED